MVRLWAFTLKLSEESLWYSRFKKKPKFSEVKLSRDELAYVMVDGEEVVAYGHLQFFPQKWKKHVCRLGVVVADKYQGKGCGKRMVKHLLRMAKRRGVEKVWLSVHQDNFKAFNLYRSLGFTVEGLFKDEERFKGTSYNVYSMAKFLK